MPRPVNMNTEICNLIKKNQSIIDDVALFKEDKVICDNVYIEFCRNSMDLKDIIDGQSKRIDDLQQYITRLERTVESLKQNSLDMRSSRFYRKTMDMNYTKRQYARREDKMRRYREGDTDIQRCVCGELLIKCYRGGMEEHKQTAKHREAVERMNLERMNLEYKIKQGKDIEIDLDKLGTKFLLSSHLALRKKEQDRRMDAYRRELWDNQ